MAVAVNGSVGTKVYTGGVTTKDYTFTVSAGSNLALLVSVVLGSASDASGVTAVWDQGGTNQSMTQLIIEQNSGNGTSVWFGLRNPTVVTNGIVRVSWTTTQTDCFIVGICFAGVAQTNDATAFPHTAGSNSTGTNTVSLTSATGNMCVGCEIPGSLGTTTGTQIYQDDASGGWINAAAEYDNGSATVTIGMPGAGCRAVAAVDIGAAAGASFTPWGNMASFDSYPNEPCRILAY